MPVQGSSAHHKGRFTADVVVIGAGLSGLVAAATAYAAGKRVAIFDQEPAASLGGQAPWSFGGLFMVDTPEQRRLGVRDSTELALDDWMASAAFDRPEDAMARQWAAAYVDFASGEKRSWLRSLGIGFFPLGWARIVRLPAARYANLLADAESHPDFAHFAPLADVFDGKSDDEAEYARIVDVLHGFDVPVPDCERIRAVHGAMVELGLASVSDFAERAGLSVRALERICRRHFGFPPKLLLRRQRFMRSLAAWMLGGMGRWSPAIDELYTDQAHFNRDFHAFMGMGPSEYAALPHPILSAFMEQRARTLGSPAQTLDRPAQAS